MNENEFELDGKVYVAVSFDERSKSSCVAHCDAWEFCSRVKCITSERKDNRNVIFMEKQ